MARKLRVISFLLTIVIIITGTYTLSASDKDTINVIVSFMKQRHVLSAIIFASFKKEGKNILKCLEWILNK